MRPGRHVTAYRCPNGTTWLHEHDVCPCCERGLNRVRIPAEATLFSHTTVRVTPDGAPVRLGVAVTASGATTLCIIDGNIRGNGRDRVRLIFRDGKFYALGRGARLTRRPGQSASRVSCKKS